MFSAGATELRHSSDAVERCHKPAAETYPPPLLPHPRHTPLLLSQGRKTAAEQARASRAERAERAKKKAQDQAARVLQRVWRGHVVRQLWYATLRKRWRTELAAARSLSDAIRLASVLTLFGTRKADTAHLVTPSPPSRAYYFPVSNQPSLSLSLFLSSSLPTQPPHCPSILFGLAVKFAICELVTMKLVAADCACPVSPDDAHRLRRFSSAVLR